VARREHLLPYRGLLDSYVGRARELYHSEGIIEVDPPKSSLADLSSQVSFSEGGAWVEAWFWMSYPQEVDDDMNDEEIVGNAQDSARGYRSYFGSEIEIDPGAVVSRHDVESIENMGGVYVQAWVWVPEDEVEVVRVEVVR
jgi:uncharacterized Fe-S cluster protein YjdI